MAAPKLSILHTSPATVGLFPALIRQERPDVEIVNLLDDSILPELARNGADLSAVRPRWSAYARIARDGGADLIFNACSSIGELCAPVSQELGLPIVRVDSAMARAAVARGGPIAVIATLATTLGPTTRLLAEAAGGNAAVEPVLVEGAYAALLAGDQTEHDRRVVQAIEEAGRSAACIVLAQASMARVLPEVDPTIAVRCLNSPPFAVADVVAALDRL